MSGFEISADRARVDRAAVHAFLSQQAHWSLGIDRARVDRAIDGSLCFGAYADGKQIGFARVISDCATFAYLCDVFVIESWRGRGVARALMQTIDGDPRLQELRRFLLFTADAHRLYAGFGFTALQRPERGMERLRTDLYTRTPIESSPTH